MMVMCTKIDVSLGVHKIHGHVLLFLNPMYIQQDKNGPFFILEKEYACHKMHLHSEKSPARSMLF